MALPPSKSSAQELHNGFTRHTPPLHPAIVQIEQNQYLMSHPFFPVFRIP